MHLESRIIDSKAKFLALAQDWNDCLTASDFNSLFLRHEWITTYIANINDYDRLWIIVVYDGAVPVGIFPACLAKRKIHRSPFRAITFLSNYYSPFCSPIASLPDHHETPGVDDCIIDACRACGKAWDVMLLENIPEEIAASARFQDALMRSGLPFVEHDRRNNWYLKAAGMTYKQYLETRSPKRRTKWNYERRRFESLPDAETIIYTTETPALETAIEDYYRVYEHSWKKSEPYSTFHADVIRMAARNSWLRLGFLRLNDHPIAAQLWLVYRQTASIVKVAYDESYCKYSPGTVLTLSMMQHVLDHDHVAEVDFLLGDDPYKQEWMSDCRARISLLIYNKRTIRGNMLHAFDRYLYPMIKDNRANH